MARLAPPIIIIRFHDLIDSDLWTLLDRFRLSSMTQQTLTRLRPCQFLRSGHMDKLISQAMKILIS